MVRPLTRYNKRGLVQRPGGKVSQAGEFELIMIADATEEMDGAD